jgi:light-independent protochlorophyllide reductase subunit B
MPGPLHTWHGTNSASRLSASAPTAASLHGTSGKRPYLAVEQAVQQLEPELILGTQMERHIAKRLGIACAVISGPVHVQDFPAAYAPQMGFEGANVLFDAWVHPLVMGLEEHLLGMFSEDFEFNNDTRPSHLGGGSRKRDADGQPGAGQAAALWDPDAEKALTRIPFFVRGKARRNTEAYARELGLQQISLETLYDAKAHYGR